jgi:hypothetical protein
MTVYTERMTTYREMLQRRDLARDVNDAVRDGLARLGRAVRVARKGLFYPYAWPGGYQMVYYDREGNTLCPDCAKAEYIEQGTKFTGDIYYEGPDEQCENCYCAIPSAYGDPDAPDDETEGEAAR